MWPAKQSYLNPDPQEIEGQQKKDISRKTCRAFFSCLFFFFLSIFTISNSPYSAEHAMSESFCHNFV